MIIKINDLPPNINKFIGRTNIWEYQRDKKAYHKLIKLSTIGLNPNYKRVDMKVTYHFPDRRIRDTHNMTKCLLDGLVDAGIIIDDNYMVLRNYTECGVYDKGQRYVEIDIKEVEYE